MLPIRFAATVLTLLAITWFAGSGRVPPLSARELQSSVLPDGVQALLPPGATPASAQIADLIGDGGTEWAVLFGQQGNFAESFSSPGVLIAAYDGSSWYAAAEVSYQDDVAFQPRLNLEDIAGTTAVAASWFHGAHGTELLVLRWDGAAFSKAFDRSDDAPGASFEDVDGDGIPELVDVYSSYCLSHAGGPELLTIYQWDGVSFSPMCS